MRPMVNYRLINGKGQNGIDAIYMLYELSPATGQSFRDLGTQEWQRISIFS